MNDLVDDIGANGPFTEVVSFVDGRNLPVDSGLSLPDRHQPAFTSNVTYFSISMVDRRGYPSTNEKPSDFSLALIDGLRGAATNMSSRITNQSLGSYVTMRMSDSQTKPLVRYHGSGSSIVIAEVASTAA